MMLEDVLLLMGLGGVVAAIALGIVFWVSKPARPARHRDG